MRPCTPNPARLWIDRQAVAALRAERELGQTPDPARPMFKLWTPQGPIISARRVYWFGATEAIFDPSRPSMLEHASVWIETTAPVMADGQVYARGECDAAAAIIESIEQAFGGKFNAPDSYLSTDGSREPPAADTPMDREISD